MESQKTIEDWKAQQIEKSRQEIIRIQRAEHARKVDECLRYFNKK